MKGSLSYNKKEFSSLLEFLDEKIERLEKAVEFQFINVVGPKATSNAKNYSMFKDQTGNLRSSMGFILAKNGRIINTGGFEAVQGPDGNGGEGVAEGKKYAEELARSSGNGYALIIVAAMPYAQYVEAKGYNVLTQTETFLESEVEAMIDKVLKQAGFKR